LAAVAALSHAAACEMQRKFPPSTAEEVMAGRLTVSPFPQVTIDSDRNGDVNWYADPYSHPSWTVYYRSAAWVVPLVDRYLAGVPNAADYRARAEALLRDWLRDVPRNQRNPSTLICSARAFPGEAWLESQIPPQVDAFASVWSGAWNHGLMEAITLLRIGCGYPADIWGGRPLSWRELARKRLSDSFAPNPLGPAIDSQGAMNEQATGYASLTRRLWEVAAQRLTDCGYSVPSVMRVRTALMPLFIAHSVAPSGTMVQIGDTYASPPQMVLGTPVEYAATKGASGSPPASNVAIYSAGYVFGRSGWGTQRPFGAESFYSLRFGRGRQVHGHHDHMSLTYYARGRELLVDSGHVGYEAGAYRDYLRSPRAHNVMILPGASFSGAATTTLTRSAVGSDGQFYEVADTAFGGLDRRRSVYVSQRPDLVIVFDRVRGGSSTTRYQQLWHLDPTFAIERIGRSFATATVSGANTRLWLGQVPFPNQAVPPGSTWAVRGETNPYQGWVSRQALSRIKAPVVSMSRTGRSTAMLTVITPARTMVGVRYYLTRRPDGWYRLDVYIGDAVSRYAVSPGGYLKRA
jgi:hypothetical protein